MINLEFVSVFGFVPKGQPRIARSFNCGKTIQTIKPRRGDRKIVAGNSATPPGLMYFYHPNPQLKLRATFISASGAFRPKLKRRAILIAPQALSEQIHSARIHPTLGDGRNSINLPQVRGQDVEFVAYLATVWRTINPQVCCSPRACRSKPTHSRC